MGHLGRKAPSPEKKKAVSEDQEGCGQTSQKTSPDWFEGHLNNHNPTWLQDLACDIPEANWHVNNIANHPVCDARHVRQRLVSKKFEKLSLRQNANDHLVPQTYFG